MRRLLASFAVTAAGIGSLLALKPHQPAPLALPSSQPPASAPSASPGGKPSTGSGSSSTGTYTGDVIDTKHGPVQVRVTLSAGRLTGVTVLQAPGANPRDRELSSYALPVLTREALTAQSARIDTVSGATYTSEGYAQSLQSALDQAHV
ncbi:FMN-binding protein [Streptomyces sp. NPDC059175]|uniref:FMN-binding protein n=1 Tax=unclassified Streptomyces TaxID=2593676 RepID=UPI0036C5B4C3